MPVLPVSRLLDELRFAPSRASVDAALSSLVVKIEAGGVATVSCGEGTPLFPRGSEGKVSRGEGTPLFARSSEGRTLAAEQANLALVRVAPGVYERTPTSDARTRLLAAARNLAPCVEVHAPLVTDGTWRGRLAFDVPRRAARALGLSVAEPGDRVTSAYAHAFFDDELLIDEAARAGLSFVTRRGAWIVLEQGPRSHEQAAPFALELLRVIRAFHSADRLRLSTSPKHAVTTLRARGHTAETRGPIGRARLRRAVGWVDATIPGAPNCFRRVLIEIALDAGAASQPLVFGLNVGQTGHVAFENAEDRPFDVAFKL